MLVLNYGAGGITILVVVCTLERITPGLRYGSGR